MERAAALSPRARALLLGALSLVVLGAGECEHRRVGPQRTVVLLAFFAGPFEAYPWPADAANAERYFFSGEGSLDAFLREVSFGRAWLRGEVRGFYRLPLSWGAYCGAGGACQWHRLREHALAAADADVDFRFVDRIVLVFGGAPVPFAYATLGKETFATADGPVTASVAWLDRATMARPAARAHELGHNLGARHAASAACGELATGPDGDAFVLPALPRSVETLARDGFFFGERCPVSTYGDDQDAMGGGAEAPRHYASLLKERSGWLSPGQVRRLAPGRGAVVELAPIELASDGVQALEIPVFEGFQPGAEPSWLFAYRLEYRREVGADAGSGVEGVLVRLVLHPDFPADFDTLTFAPEPFVLRPGTRLEDFHNEDLTVRVLALSEASATLEITYH